MANLPNADCGAESRSAINSQCPRQTDTGKPTRVLRGSTVPVAFPPLLLFFLFRHIFWEAGCLHER